mmetsp:Transcript_2452/g.8688  ORF Transcript_2452/g.8688 Transcript_2452/m.8688 type:complete len:206 (+) Transcript_2452:1902-2519(+)
MASSTRARKVPDPGPSVRCSKQSADSSRLLGVDSAPVALNAPRTNAGHRNSMAPANDASCKWPTRTFRMLASASVRSPTSPFSVSRVRYRITPTARMPYDASAAAFLPGSGHGWHSGSPGDLLNSRLHTAQRLLSYPKRHWKLVPLMASQAWVPRHAWHEPAPARLQLFSSPEYSVVSRHACHCVVSPEARQYPGSVRSDATVAL